ncbi:MAG: four helix bundle protein [Bacteroidales bacterium]|nr:four helix bundle protein [Bacteroidales bacterium]
METRSFTELTVWKKAHQFVLDVNKYSAFFPSEELYGLTSQLRRAAVSIAANIAEGYKRKGKKDKLRFYNFAQSSLEECRYYLILSRDLKFGENNDMMNNLEEVSKMLESYSIAIRKSMSITNKMLFYLFY